MIGLWTIGELAMVVEQALAEMGYSGQKSARVREVPDRRTIRYYTTLGLLDKPSEIRGRTAYYGQRHLEQLVAIKRLQSAGKPLVEIQAILTGAGRSTLATWSALPEGFAARLDHGRVASAEGTSDAPVGNHDGMQMRPVRQADFWAAAPQGNSPLLPVNVATALHLKVLDNVTLVIEGVDSGELDAGTLSRLKPVLESLKNALLWKGGSNKPVPHDERENFEEPGSEL